MSVGWFVIFVTVSQDFGLLFGRDNSDGWFVIVTVIADLPCLLGCFRLGGSNRCVVVAVAQHLGLALNRDDSFRSRSVVV